MHLVADTVTRAGIVDTVLFCYGLDKPMVVGIFKSGLQSIMVYVSNRAFRLNSVNSHSLKFKISHSTRCILSKGLVDTKSYFRTYFHLTLNQMRFNEFLC